MPTSGPELYELYRNELSKRNVLVEAFDHLETPDQQAWDALANLVDVRQTNVGTTETPADVHKRTGVW